MTYVNLIKSMINILAIHYCYNNIKEKEENFQKHTTIDHLSKIQKTLYGTKQNKKVPLYTIFFKMVVSKLLILSKKIIGLQCTWVKRLFDNNTHNWKI